MEEKIKKASNYDELLMQHSMLFTDTLKDLKMLSKQLYSAAEQFELSYSKQNQQQQIMGTIKDYVNNAIVSTVDHLGSIAYQMNQFLDERVNEASTAEIHMSCLGQRLRTVRNFTDLSGISQESVVIKTPKYHKRYIIPEKEQDSEQCGSVIKHYPDKPNNAILATEVELHSPIHKRRKGYFISPSTKSFSPVTFSFANTAPNKPPEKRSISPLRFPLKHSSSSNGRKQQYLSDLNRPATMIDRVDNARKKIQPYSMKSKPLLKTLFSIYRHKSY